MNRANLVDVLNSRVLLCDGGMGTQLMARGMVAGVCGELWNIDRPDQVQAIHADYRSAGCDLLTTNTFGGTPICLSKHALDTRVADINRAGARLARQAAGDAAWVVGDVGPIGEFMEPLGDATPEQVLAAFAQQIAALYEGGVDAVLIETMTDIGEMKLAIQAAKSAGPRPVIATYAFDRGDGVHFRTMMGAGVPESLAAAAEAGADVIGANCGASLGLPDYVRLAEQLVAAAQGRPVIIQPNAGSPRQEGGAVVYPATPQDMADLVPALLKTGLRIIGGCCGTTPAHLRAMRPMVR